MRRRHNVRVNNPINILCGLAIVQLAALGFLYWKIMATKDEISAGLDEVSGILTEIGGDVENLLTQIDELKAAAEAGNLDDIKAKIDAIKGTATGINERVPAVVPTPADPQPEQPTEDPQA